MGTADTKTAIFGVEILRQGDFTDATGKPVSLGVDKLQAVAGSYDPEFHEAKLNTDHAESGPALGRVSRLYVEGDKLKADLLDVDSEVAREMVVGGKYPCRSAELYPDLEGRGPYLRNLAILGTHPPAVKGLARINPTQLVPQTAFAFAETEDGVQTYSYSTEEVVMANEPAPEILALTEKLDEQAKKLAEYEAKLAEKEAEEAEITKLKEDNLRLVEEADARAKSLKLAEAKTRAADKLAKLKEERRITPGMEEAGIGEMLTAIELMEEPVAVGDKQITFGELIDKVLAAIPPMPETGEHAPAAPSEQKVGVLTEYDLRFAEKNFPDPKKREAHLKGVEAKKLALMQQGG